MRALLVVNQRSRRGRAAGIVAKRELAARGVEVVSLAGGRRLDAASPFDCIVAVGGDGTLVRLIGRAMRANVPVGLVPGGTFNELARALGIPLDVGAACSVIAAGHTRAIDVAQVNGFFFVSEASIGISSRAARLQTSDLKQRFGFFAVIVTALQALRFSRPMYAQVEYDGNVERFKTVQLTVANSHRFGGLFEVGDAAIDDGWLDLYSVEIDNFREAFSVARAIFQGRRQSVPGLRTFRSTQFTIRQHRSHHISADGEAAGKTPATFALMPKALRVLVPE
jgi:diacylglycerol kinase (ATP)